mmetsp:Transcript_20816/g.41608  ORF Transcript_20816/g.41608 Transcript_20816/m.41608 type:complete len:308 (+) Transcript_20816:396-1319(+)
MEFLAKILVGVVDRGVENSEPVLADRAANGVDADGVQVLGPAVRAALNEHLLVEIVVEASHEHMDVAHDLQYVKALVKAAHGEEVVGQLDAKLLLGEVLHLAVGQPVVEGDRGQVVEACLEVLLNPLVDVKDDVEDNQRLHEDKGLDLQPLVDDRVGRRHVVQILSVHVQPEIVLHLSAELVHNLGLEHVLEHKGAVLVYVGVALLLIFPVWIQLRCAPEHGLAVTCSVDQELEAGDIRLLLVGVHVREEDREQLPVEVKPRARAGGLDVRVEVGEEAEAAKQGLGRLSLLKGDPSVRGGARARSEL